MIDDNLWFMDNCCAGKHYFVGNPHTHVGRMWAWCPRKEASFFVSKNMLGDMSEQSKYWIKGFLAGCEPKPPCDDDGQADFGSLKYETWKKAIALFHVTGCWYSGERVCGFCRNELLASEPKKICNNCQKNK